MNCRWLNSMQNHLCQRSAQIDRNHFQYRQFMNFPHNKYLHGKHVLPRSTATFITKPCTLNSVRLRPIFYYFEIEKVLHTTTSCQRLEIVGNFSRFSLDCWWPFPNEISNLHQFFHLWTLYLSNDILNHLQNADNNIKWSFFLKSRTWRHFKKKLW